MLRSSDREKSSKSGVSDEIGKVDGYTCRYYTIYYVLTNLSELEICSRLIKNKVKIEMLIEFIIVFLSDAINFKLLLPCSVDKLEIP